MEPGVYALKTTGERVYVMQTTDYVIGSGDGNGRLVRRAVMGEGGIFHGIETFHKDELESLEENFQREINEMLLKAKLQQEALKKARQADEAAEGESVAAKLQVN